MGEPTVGDTKDDQMENPYSRRGRKNLQAVVGRVVADPIYDTALFIEALQVGLIKAAHVVFTELADATKRQLEGRDDAAGRLPQTSHPKTRSGGDLDKPGSRGDAPA